MYFAQMSPCRKACIVGMSLCLLVIVIASFSCLLLERDENADALTEARRILPGYSIVFDGHTNEIQRYGSLRSFSRQHEMMDYLSIFAPYVEQYNHPTNHPIMIFETEDRVIIELPSRFKFPPYNWTIYWGSSYYFRIEIDKKTKQIVKALQG